MSKEDPNEAELDVSKLSDEEFSDLLDKVVDALHDEAMEPVGYIAPITPEEEVEALKRLAAFNAAHAGCDEDEPEETD